MKYKLKVICSIITLSSCLLLSGCGSNKGRPEVLKQVKEGTYTTESDADSISSTNWKIESVQIENADESIKALIEDMQNVTITVYIGYKVEGDSIKYAFMGSNENDEPTIMYAIQTTSNKITYVEGNYSDMNDILGIEDNSPTDAQD